MLILPPKWSLAVGIAGIAGATACTYIRFAHPYIFIIDWYGFHRLSDPNSADLCGDRSIPLAFGLLLLGLAVLKGTKFCMVQIGISHVSIMTIY